MAIIPLGLITDLFTLDPPAACIPIAGTSKGTCHGLIHSPLKIAFLSGSPQFSDTPMDGSLMALSPSSWGIKISLNSYSR